MLDLLPFALPLILLSFLPFVVLAMDVLRDARNKEIARLNAEIAGLKAERLKIEPGPNLELYHAVRRSLSDRDKEIEDLEDEVTALKTENALLRAKAWVY